MLNAAVDQEMLSLFDDVSAIQNTLIHENFHRIDNLKEMKIDFFRHAQIYLDQITHETFLNTTSDYQIGTIGSFANHLMNVYTNDPTGDTQQVAQLISKFNSTFKGRYSLTLNTGAGTSEAH